MQHVEMRTTMEFRKITLEDKNWIEEKLREDDRRGCEYTFCNNYIWRDIYQVEVACVCDCLVVKYEAEGEECFAFPIGAGDKAQAVRLLSEEARENGRLLFFDSMLEEDKALLEREFPGQFIIHEERDGFDYLYTTEKLSTLAGKKLHGKRNHINRFLENQNWSYEPMTEANKEECLAMDKKWCDMQAEKWDQGMLEEQRAVRESIEHFSELGFVGGVLRVDGAVVAFTIGEPLNSDTFVVHIEKAFADIQGAYPMINQQFVLHECQGFSYVNREDDTGEEGLRKAKLSYYPDILLKKYSASLSKKQIVYAEEAMIPELKELWMEAFGDEPEYVDQYFAKRFTPDNMLVYIEDGRPVSMISMLPATLRLADQSTKEVYYIYAVATREAYRKRGLARELLMEGYRRKRAPFLLVPADGKLEKYYQNIGFVPVPVMQTERFSRALGDQTQQEDMLQAQTYIYQKESGNRVEPADGPYWLLTVTPSEYRKLRDSYFVGIGYVAWDDAAVAYALCENDYCDGYAYKVLHGDQKKLLLYRMEESTMEIIETTLTDEEILGVIKKLKLTPDQVSVRRPVKRKDPEKGKITGMIYGKELSGAEQVYLNLILD